LLPHVTLYLALLQSYGVSVVKTGVAPYVWSSTGCDTVFWFTGDSAYPLSERSLTPYNDPRAEQMIRFNAVHRTERVVVENAFDHPKGQWRCLKNIVTRSVVRANKTILACLKLNNSMIDHQCSFISMPTPESFNRQAQQAGNGGVIARAL